MNRNPGFRVHASFGLLGLALAGLLLLPIGCVVSPGYRDQAMDALKAPPEKRGYRGLGKDAVQFEEWLSAYRFHLPAEPGGGPRLYAVAGATDSDRAEREGWLLLAVSAPAIPAGELSPRRWVVLLDTGRTMRGEPWRLAINGAARLAGQLAEADRLRIVECGSGDTVGTGWLTPQMAVAELRRRELRPAGGFGRDASVSGAALANLPASETMDGANTAVFLFTDGAGAEKKTWSLWSGTKRVGADANALRGRGREAFDGRVNVIGVRGGDEAALRNLARAAGGSYVYLADEGDIERLLVKRGSELFDAAYRDVMVRLAFPDGSTGFGQTFDFPRFVVPSRAERSGESVAYPPGYWVNERGLVGRMGPGEVWMRVLRVSTWNLSADTPFRFEMKGFDHLGRPVERSVSVKPGTVDLAWPKSPEERALRKALAIRDEVKALRMVLGNDRYDAGEKYWRPAVDQARYNLQQALAVLGGDEELARDAAEWEAISRLGEEDIQRLRKEWPLHLSPGQRIRKAVTLVGAAGALTVGGAVVVTGGIPFIFLFAITKPGCYSNIDSF